MKRDSMVWTITLVSSVLVYLSGHFDLLQNAIPGLAPVWVDRITLLSAVLGFVAGYLKMSPLPLSPNSSVAQDPDHSFSPLSQPPKV